MSEIFTKIKNDLITSSLSDKELRVLLYLIIRSKNGICFPSIRTMATEIGKSKESVRTTLIELENKNIISKENRFLGTGKKTSNVYLIDESFLVKSKKKELEEMLLEEKINEKELEIANFDWLDEDFN